MKDYSKFLFPGLIPVLAIVANAQSPRVDLFVQPDIQSEILASVNLDDERLGDHSPVLDESKAALGWHWAEFSSEISGYVKDSQIGKDLAPVEDALIYLKPSEDSPVLGTIEPDDSFEILDNGPWWEILFDRPIPVYFIPESPAEVRSEAPAEAPEPERESSSGDGDNQTSVELFESNDPASQGQIEETPVESESSGSVNSGSRESTRSPWIGDSPGAAALGSSIEGTFRKSKRRFGIWTPPYPFYVEGSSGKRIAWIDTSELVVATSLRQYLDERVILYGERVYDKENKSWKIVAHNIRLQ